MAYRNRKAYSKTARRGIPRAQDGWGTRFKNWAGDKWQDLQDSSVNMTNVFGSSPETKAMRNAFEVQDPRSQYHQVRAHIGESPNKSMHVNPKLIEYVSQHPENPNYAKLEAFNEAQNPDQTFAGPMAPGQTGFDSFGHGEGDMDVSTEALLASNTTTPKAPPFVKRGGILKRGGSIRTSNVLGKGGTPKARRGGSVGKNGIL